LPILLTLMMEAIRSSATSAFATDTWGNVPTDGFLNST
jgi:hypothetical protein